jgi:hypothetical protein
LAFTLAFALTRAGAFDFAFGRAFDLPDALGFAEPDFFLEGFTFEAGLLFFFFTGAAFLVTFFAEDLADLPFLELRDAIVFRGFEEILSKNK